MKAVRVARRIVAISVVTTFCGPLLILLKRFAKLPAMPYDAVQRLLYRWLRCSMGVGKLYIIGKPEQKRPLVMMVNHISYVDILVLGSYLNCTFVSKEEVRDWPIVGWVANQYGTLFISRNPRKVKEGLEKMRIALQQGKPVVLFPEGTTSDGCQVLEFKSSYFELPQGTWVQPVSLRYSHLNGLPLTRFVQKLLSWRGTEGLLAHLKKVLGMRKIAATLTFHPALPIGSCRKELSKQCFESVQKGFQGT